MGDGWYIGAWKEERRPAAEFQVSKGVLAICYLVEEVWQPDAFSWPACCTQALCYAPGPFSKVWRPKPSRPLEP